MSLEFSKYSAAGNDFVIVDAGRPGADDPATLAGRLCPRRLAVGADGLMVVGPGDSGDEVKVLYRNADGSAAAFCGNGARCAAHFAWSRGLAAEQSRLRFEKVLVEAEILEAGAEVRVTLGNVETASPVGGIDAGRLGILEGLEVRAGVPHVVVRVEAVGEIDLAALFRRLAAAGEGIDANLTVVEVAARRELRVRTWERGCGETLACGSAALAAAAWAREALGGEGRWIVLPPSGLPLTVESRSGGRMALAGEVREVFRGRFA